MSIASLISGFKNINIESGSGSHFVLNNGVKTEGIKFYRVTDVTLNFYQVWSMFNGVPIVNKTGKVKYEWRFTTKESSDVVFVLCNVPFKEKDLNFMNTKYWRILCNKQEDEIINEFLATLCEALECYNLYYKESIESHKFSSEDPIINGCLEHIKFSIIKNKDLLKSL